MRLFLLCLLFAGCTHAPGLSYQPSDTVGDEQDAVRGEGLESYKGKVWI